MNVTFRIMKTASNHSHSEGKVQQNHILRLMANPKYSLEARKLRDHLKPFRLNPQPYHSFCTTCVVLFMLVTSDRIIVLPLGTYPHVRLFTQ